MIPALNIAKHGLVDFKDRKTQSGELWPKKSMLIVHLKIDPEPSMEVVFFVILNNDKIVPGKLGYVSVEMRGPTR